jgi:hypothetical protein
MLPLDGKLFSVNVDNILALVNSGENLLENR